MRIKTFITLEKLKSLIKSKKFRYFILILFLVFEPIRNLFFKILFYILLFLFYILDKIIILVS